MAFEIAAYAPPNVERATRLKCRDKFRTSRLLARIVPDLQKLLGVKDGPGEEELVSVDSEKALPGQLWGPSAEGGSVAGGVRYSDPILDDGSEDGPFGPDPGWRETWGFLGPAKKKPEEPTP